MKNILMIGSSLMSAYAGFTLLPAQEFSAAVQTKDSKDTVVAERSARNKPVTGSPFSAVAVTESIQTLADGNRIVNKNQQKLYRDSQGRERREVDQRSVLVVGEKVAVTTVAVAISDPVAGVNFTLNSTARTAIKRAVANGLMGQFQTANSPIEAGARVAVEKLPATTIEGVFA